ncbi:MAG: threonine aldolase family protein [Lachnospirales bacterium]
MLNFKNDYTELAHEKILKKIIDVNKEFDEPYGFDSYSEKTENLIRKKLENNEIDVHFISGGTQANIVAISSGLYPFESVIATDISHINGHETGAIELTGHKIHGIPHINGKLNLAKTKEFYKTTINAEYMAVPKLICLTNATEYGTYYTKKELEEIYKFCKESDMYLFIDGARMATALSAKKNDIEYSELCNLCDMFYLGGTKNGAMLGEALVIVNDQLKKNYKNAIKQRGAMLAKGRLMSIQFYELFIDDLYIRLAEHANDMANKLRSVLKKNKFEIYLESDTNQTFVIMDNDYISELEKNIRFSNLEVVDEKRSLVRFVTSWATVEDDIAELEKILKQ